MIPDCSTGGQMLERTRISENCPALVDVVIRLTYQLVSSENGRREDAPP